MYHTPANISMPSSLPCFFLGVLRCIRVMWATATLTTLLEMVVTITGTPPHTHDPSVIL